MTDNPYDAIRKLPSLCPTIPDTGYENSLSPQRPQPENEKEELSSRFPMEFPPQKTSDKAEFPSRPFPPSSFFSS